MEDKFFPRTGASGEWFQDDMLKELISFLMVPAKMLGLMLMFKGFDQLIWGYMAVPKL